MRKTIRFIRNLFSNDEHRKMTALYDFGHYLFPQYRFSWPHMEWWNNAGFNEYLTRFNEKENFNTHRKWMLNQLLRLTTNVPGDTAECGVYMGASSYLICAANKRSALDRIHHCFDSFQGLSEPSSENDGDYWVSGALSVSMEKVKNNLSDFDGVKLYKGWIPEKFAEVEQCHFSFVHVDVDLYQPTKDSVKFFYDRMPEGAILVCDDYGFVSCPGATKAIDEFLQDKPEKMVALDCGGGFFIKGIKTEGEAEEY